MKKLNIASVSLAALLSACSNAATSGAPLTAAATAGAAAALGGAAGGSSPTASSVAANTSSLQMPALEAGFKRYLTPAVDVPSGTTDDWIHWVDGPTDQDYDVVALKGAQSKGGHHALMLSVAESNAVGFTRKYTERDQLSTTSVGGIGAEGNVAIPEGVVFRLRKGSYLAIQPHYLNTTERDLKGETYIDIKLTPSDPAHVVAGTFASTSLKISLPPKAQSTQDVYCDVGEDLHVLRMTNHMHYAGVRTYTEYTDPSGVTRMLKQDDVWSEDWALTPNYTNFSVAEPLLIAAGSRLHTQCIWNNASDKPVTFPEEMCVFATTILGEKSVSCIDGQFVVRDGKPASSASQSQASAGSAGSAGAGGSAPPSASAGSGATAAVGACTQSADKAVLDAPDFEDKQRTCGTMCLGLDEACSTDCLTKNTTLSAGCAACNGAQLSCGMMFCVGDCASGFMSATCRPCLETHCGEAYHACAGL